LVEKCSRAKGRNLGVELARNEIIAITDAGCVARKDWLENLTAPFKEPRVDISAGFYKMVGQNPMQKAMATFLGVLPNKFDINFLPSTRSMAFRKSSWEAVGGFPEGKGNSAEDTDFNYKAVKLGLKYSRVKNAIVEWGMPENLTLFFRKIKSYAKWDIKYGIWWHPSQRFASHNIKALLVILRYLVGAAFFVYCTIHPPLFVYFFICLFVYLFWAYRKAGFWGIILQFTSDLAVISGFASGILGK
jgi:cellulose synthase/poly-beta-1,6-N-acetylglucosamine synthase-like glycosyltransferase